ncbi:MAG: hypothetical protein JKX68_06180 [Flavobacteriales bacterium]|nr:hypothetical protein [Flavobacteriales bacterium]
MVSILLLSIVYNYHNPIYALFGFILMIVIIVLAIREKLLKPKQSNIKSIYEDPESSYLEKDVLGLDKTYINHKEPTYKSADKSKLKFITFIVLFFIGLFLLIAFTPIRYPAYKGSSSGGVIHHPDDNLSNYFHYLGWFDYYDSQEPKKKNHLDPLLIFKSKNIFENEEQSNEKEVNK